MVGNNSLEFFPAQNPPAEDKKGTAFHRELFAGPGNNQVLLARADANDGKEPAKEQPKNDEKDQKKGAEKRDVQPVSDRAVAQGAKADDPIDPYDQITKAKEKGEALELLLKQDRRPDEKIIVRERSKTDPNKIELKEMTVAARVAQLKGEIIEELKLARKGAQAILDTKNPTFDEEIKTNREKRDKLAKELGLKPEEATAERLLTEHQKANGDKDKQKKIDQLIELVASREALTMLHYAPLAVSLLESEYRARGYLNPDIKAGDSIPDSEFKQAMADLEKAKPKVDAENALFGAGNEVKQAQGMFSISDKTVHMLYAAKQQEHATKVIAELAEAKNGNKEEHLKKAVQLAENLDVPFLATEAVKADNLQSGVSLEMMNYVQAGSKANLEMAEYLESQGKLGEAQKYWTKVKTDSPELIYEGFDKDGRPKYRKYENDKTYEDLDRKITLGLSFRPGRFEQVQNYLVENIQAGQIGTSEKEGKQFLEDLRAGKYKNEEAIMNKLKVEDGKGSGTAAECLKMMKVYREQVKKDVTEANKKIDEENGKLNEQREAYVKKAVDKMTPAEKEQKAKLEAEINGTSDQKTKNSKEEELGKLIQSKLSVDDAVQHGRLERQIALNSVNKLERERYLTRTEALTDMYEGIMHLSQGAAKSANDLFRKAREKDPSLDKEVEELKKRDPEKYADAKTLTDLVKLTDNTLDAYWQRNYKKIGLAAAAAAATLTGVGVIGVCSSLEMGIMSTSILATGSGALVGGTTNWAINRTVDPKAGWHEFRDGAKLGAISAALVASPWAAQAYRAKTAADVANAAQASKVVGLAGRLGITRYTMAGAYAINGLAEAGNMFFDDKNLKDAALDTFKFGTLDGLLLGIARKWGATAPEAEAAASAAKASWARRLILPASLGYGMAAIPQIKDGKFDLKQLATEGTKNFVAFWAVRKFGLTDGKPVTGAPTMAQTTNYALRAYMMQNSWDLLIDRGMKTYMHDIAKKDYYIKDRPVNPLYGLVEDWLDYNFGSLDPAHPGDLREINRRLNEISQTVTGGTNVDHKEPDPRRNGARGQFFDYSRQGKPRDEKDK